MTKNSYTWQEIISQPETWRATLESFIAEQTTLESFLERMDFDQILVVGCGSTHYLAQTAATTLAHCTSIPARAFPSSELWLFPDTIPADRTLLLTISRSGTTTETLQALKRFSQAKAGPTLAITCYPERTLAQQTDFALVASAAQEQSIAQTRSFTSMLLLSQILAAVMARDEETLTRLQRLPNALENLVARLGDLPYRKGWERIWILSGYSSSAAVPFMAWRTRRCSRQKRCLSRTQKPTILWNSVTGQCLW